MARIRTIKPEFWSSPGIERLSPWARLLYIAMWNWADDFGRGTANLKELQAFAFPFDENDSVGTPANFRRVVAEVRDAYDVDFYEVAGRRYFAIPSWQKHQRNEKRSAARHPGPEDGTLWDFMDTDQRIGGTPDNPRHTVAELPIKVVAVTGEQGNRGTGEEQISASDDAGMFPAAPRSKRDSDYAEEFNDFWSVYPLKKGKEPALKAFIKARRSGVPLEVLRAGAERYRVDVRGVEPAKVKWPQGWINDKRWQDYDEPSVTDDDINPNEILGPDYWTPPVPPREVDDGPPHLRAEWFKAREQERKLERIETAKLTLARRSA